MRSSKKNTVVVTALSAVAVIFIASGSALPALNGQMQKGATPSLGSPVPPVGAEAMPEPGGPGEAHMRRVQESQAMDERHKKMESDADKLLKLATDLKFEVDHSTKNETSVSAFLKADQIEKLAHDVKQRLKN